jgi:hypothetical protein
VGCNRLGAETVAARRWLRLESGAQGTVVIFLNHGHGGLASQVKLSTPEPSGVALVDGMLDIAVSSSNFVVLPGSILVSDVDGDGRPDATVDYNGGSGMYLLYGGCL